jgi:hypothetical protein
VYLVIKLHEVEKNDVLPVVANGCVQGELCLGLEHAVQQWSWHGLEILTCEFILPTTQQGKVYNGMITSNKHKK